MSEISEQMIVHEDNETNNTDEQFVDPSLISKTQDALHQKDTLRSIGRWYIGETLGKGGYSWVKKGYDKKTGKSVALKFMVKAENSWADEQSKQVITEIESLKQIRHSNVIKLYAYNLNAKYPTKNKDKIDSILLVLEYAPGGELFDILYYTSALEEDVARTYFLQMIYGIEACHNAGICHRDIKPQNLLLDSRFNLKLTDFGLSKVFQSDADTVMKTTYVGTKGYQAPELLLNKSYDLSCDIFSAGVVLFILLTGYPPFEQASKKDRWFAPIVTEDYNKFWKSHKGCSITNNEKVKNLIQQMFCFDPKKRITIDEIKKHPWCLEKVLEGKDLINALRSRYRKMEMKRKQDCKKLSDLQVSITRRSLDFKNETLPLIPSEEIEGIYDMYSVVDWKNIYNVLYDIIGKNGGHVIFNDGILECTVRTIKNNDDDNNDDDDNNNNQTKQTSSIIKFEIKIWRSREFYNDNEPVYVIKCKRLEGDVLNYKQVIKELIQKKGSSVITGLPLWAEQKFNLENTSFINNNNNNYNKNFDEFYQDFDNYDQLLNQDSNLFA